MPCSDGGGPAWTVDNSGAQSRLDSYARFLCEACRLLEEAGRLPRMSKPLLAWWQQHKTEDEERARKEKEAEAITAARIKAISKLTAQERQLLGIHP